MKLIKLNAIGSTNDYLKSLSREVTLDNEVVVLAENQFEGKGQAGQKWYSEPGKNLVFSVFRRFKGVEAHSAFAINWAVSLGILKGLETFGLPALLVKWPNDILSDASKLGGILIENQWKEKQLSSSVIGIGINVNQLLFPEGVRATSMQLKASRVFDREQVLQSVLQSLSAYFDLLDQKEFSTLRVQYEEKLFRRNAVSVFQEKTGKFQAMIKGVADTGELCLQLEDNTLRYVKMKEVQLLY